MFTVAPPNFVAENTLVILPINTNSIKFTCKFNKYAENLNLYYQIHWTIQGSSTDTIVKEYCQFSEITDCDLTDQDLNNAPERIGVNVSGVSFVLLIKREIRSHVAFRVSSQ